MQKRSYQNNVEFYKMMQKIKEESKNESGKIKVFDENEKLLKIKEEMFNTQKESQKNLLNAKEEEKKANDALNEEQRKYLEQLRKYNKW